jgi:uncharacterized protein
MRRTISRRTAALTHRTAPLVALLAVLIATLAVPGTAAAHGAMGTGPLARDAAGTYRTAAGEILTLTGSAFMPSYELEGKRVFLHPDGEDRFAAWDDAEEALTLQRDAGGRVVGVSLLRGDTIVAGGARVDLHSEREVTFANGDTTLSGSVVLPAGDGPHPGVVIVHGAEAARRSSYELLASHLARRGVAVLIYDKRGVGESEGSFASATFDDLAGDALAAHQLLRSEPSVAPDRVGLLGLSQGGWVIAMAAAASDDVAFLVPVSASSFSPAAQDRWLNGNIIAHRHLHRGVNQASEKAWRMLLSTRALVDDGHMPAMPDVPGFWFHALDPGLSTASLWESVRQPVLGIWGELDCQVPAYDSLRGVQGALDRSGNPSYSLVILPRADHAITLVEPCEQETSGWSVLRFGYPDAYFPLLADWIHGHPADPARQISLPTSPTPSGLRWYQQPTDGVSEVGAFLPQVAIVLGLLSALAILGFRWLGRRALAAVRRRPAPMDPLGGVALLGALAVGLAVISLAELLLLGSPDGGFLLGGAPILGMSPLFLVATVVTTSTVVLGALRLARARYHLGVGTILPAAVLVVLAAWSAYWGLLPTWLVAG